MILCGKVRFFPIFVSYLKRRYMDMLVCRYFEINVGKGFNFKSRHQRRLSGYSLNMPIISPI